MVTNQLVDEELVKRAVAAGGHTSEGEAIKRALEEYITHQQQLKVRELFGTIDYDPDYDYKQGRRKR